MYLSTSHAGSSNGAMKVIRHTGVDSRMIILDKATAGPVLISLPCLSYGARMVVVQLLSLQLFVCAIVSQHNGDIFTDGVHTLEVGIKLTSFVLVPYIEQLSFFTNKHSSRVVETLVSEQVSSGSPPDTTAVRQQRSATRLTLTTFIDSSS